MSIHLVADNVTRLAALRKIVEPNFAATSELLHDGSINRADRDIEAVVIAVDLRDVGTIAALKQASDRLRRVGRRIFVIEQRARLSIVQAQALGATRVLTGPVKPAQLLEALFAGSAAPMDMAERASPAKEAASAAARSIASMFSAVCGGTLIDVNGTRDAGQKIADSIAELGLKHWLKTVRSHHESTYQHILLVTGVTIDFGLHLGMSAREIERLYMGAMFHDIGKARIPLAVLDKPGRLDPEERALIETHPVVGYDVLKDSTGVSDEVLDAVRHHHEYLDGSGYPDALSGEGITDIVRLLTICDIFAALVEERPYRATMSREDAYGIVSGMVGKLEKPLVAAFKDVALTR